MQSACLKGAMSGLTHRGKHAVSFDRLVGGGKELWRKGDAEGFCGLQMITSSNLIGVCTGED